MLTVSRIVNSFYTSNTFVLSDDGSASVWLVDCGDYATQVRPLLHDRIVKGILLTHTHSDHIYGLNDVVSDFSDVRIVTNAFGKVALGDPKLNVSKYHTEVSDFVISSEDNIVIAEEGTEIELFAGIRARVLSTPGHDRSCLSYIIGHYLFSGDSYIPGERLIASFPNSNKQEARASYARLVELGMKYSLCPGHGTMLRNDE